MMKFEDTLFGKFLAHSANQEETTSEAGKDVSDEKAQEALNEMILELIPAEGKEAAKEAISRISFMGKGLMDIMLTLSLEMQPVESIQQTIVLLPEEQRQSMLDCLSEETREKVLTNMPTEPSQEMMDLLALEIRKSELTMKVEMFMGNTLKETLADKGISEEDLTEEIISSIVIKSIQEVPEEIKQSLKSRYSSTINPTRLPIKLVVGMLAELEK